MVDGQSIANRSILQSRVKKVFIRNIVYKMTKISLAFSTYTNEQIVSLSSEYPFGHEVLDLINKGFDFLGLSSNI